jgi:hypothetical protein
VHAAHEAPERCRRPGPSLIAPALRVGGQGSSRCATCTCARAYRHLKPSATPSRNKLTCMAAATALFDLGLTPMETCDQGPGKVYEMTRYRDRVLIALLISCPIRMRNLASIEVGRHLVWNGQNYQLHFTAAETKTKRPYVASVPPELTAYIDGWLQVQRPVFQTVGLAKGGADTGGNHLWLDRWGRPMSGRAIRRQIERYAKSCPQPTRKTVGSSRDRHGQADRARSRSRAGRDRRARSRRNAGTGECSRARGDRSPAARGDVAGVITCLTSAHARAEWSRLHSQSSGPCPHSGKASDHQGRGSGSHAVDTLETSGDR